MQPWFRHDRNAFARPQAPLRTGAGRTVETLGQAVGERIPPILPGEPFDLP